MTRLLALFALLMLTGMISLAGLSPASAQATRTWVSGVGDDVNPCSRTAPCKTFAGAITKTAAGGQINVLDPGGYGTVTITKSISIVADVAMGGVLNSSVNGIVVNAGVNDEVHLVGLDIQGSGLNGLNGIKVIKAKVVTVTGCRIVNQRSPDPNGAGILVAPTDGTVTWVMVRDTSVSASTVGLKLVATNGKPRAMVTNSSLSRLGTGVSASGDAGVLFSGSEITLNTVGIAAGAGSTIATTGDNLLANNGTNGAFNQTRALQ